MFSTVHRESWHFCYRFSFSTNETRTTTRLFEIWNRKLIVQFSSHQTGSANEPIVRPFRFELNLRIVSMFRKSQNCNNSQVSQHSFVQFNGNHTPKLISVTYSAIHGTWIDAKHSFRHIIIVLMMMMMIRYWQLQSL